jgi:hypothetical protein
MKIPLPFSVLSGQDKMSVIGIAPAITHNVLSVETAKAISVFGRVTTVPALIPILITIHLLNRHAGIVEDSGAVTTRIVCTGAGGACDVDR